jgi:hypothetical protein
MIMKNNTTLIILVLLFPATLWAESVPGQRPDLAPSKLMKIAGSSIEDKIINQAEKVREYREEWQKFSYTEKRGIWPFRYSPKEKAQKNFRIEEEILKDLLASTPSSSSITKAEMYEDADEVKNANSEAVEIKLSLENLRNTMLDARKELMAKPSDLTIASTYYNAHATCLATTIQMAEEFVQNIDAKYVPSINELRIKFQVLIDKSDEKLRKATDDEHAQKIREIKANQITVLKALKEAYAILPKQKEWAQNRISELQKRLEIAYLATETVDAAKEAKSMIQNFGIDYEALTIQPPPLIVFEVDLSDFEMPDVKEIDSQKKSQSTPSPNSQ